MEKQDGTRKGEGVTIALRSDHAGPQRIRKVGPARYGHPYFKYICIATSSTSLTARKD